MVCSKSQQPHLQQTRLNTKQRSDVMSGVTVGGHFFKYDCQEIDLRLLTAKGLTEDDLKELGEALKAGKFHRLKKLNLVSI